MTISRVVASAPLRGWTAVAIISGIMWITAITANIVPLFEGGKAEVPPQFNAFAFSLAGSLTIVAALLFTLRHLRQGQGEVCLRVARLTAAYRNQAEVCERLLGVVKQNSGVVDGNTRAIQDVGSSYANLLADLGMAPPRKPSQPLPTPRQGWLN